MRRAFFTQVLLALTLLAAMTLPLQAQPLLGGFVEGTQAWRLQNSAALDGGLGFSERPYPRSEMRAQFTAQDGYDKAEFYFRLDVVSDAVQAAPERVYVDFREGYLKLYLARWLDLKLGRQVATWGTGDFVFVNDTFARNWVAFFTGLADGYLKEPQGLLRSTFYMGGVTLDLARSPHFTPDVLPQGQRLSIYNPFSGETVGADALPPIVAPRDDLSNGETFGRLFGNKGSLEWALYGYYGFWSTPQAVVPVPADSSAYLAYPRKGSGGFSLRGPLGRTLSNLEMAYYYSADDSDGSDPLIPNSEVRGLVGVERSLGNDWTLGAQYYGTYMMDYAGYEQGLPEGAPKFEELRSMLTGRINKMMLDQDLMLSFFGFWGISDEDWYLRLASSYRITDAVKWIVGFNLIDGNQPYTMFGQFRDNSNIYTRIRYSF